MPVGKGHLQPVTVKPLSLHSAPQPPSQLEAGLLVTTQEQWGEDKRPLLSPGNFPPLFLDGFSSPNPQKNGWAKIRKEEKKKPATKKVTGLASLLNCPICSHLKAVVLDLFLLLPLFSGTKHSPRYHLSLFEKIVTCPLQGRSPFSTLLRITGSRKHVKHPNEDPNEVSEVKVGEHVLVCDTARTKEKEVLEKGTE